MTHLCIVWTERSTDPDTISLVGVVPLNSIMMVSNTISKSDELISNEVRRQSVLPINWSMILKFIPPLVRLLYQYLSMLHLCSPATKSPLLVAL